MMPLRAELLFLLKNFSKTLKGRTLWFFSKNKSRSSFFPRGEKTGKHGEFSLQPGTPKEFSGKRKIYKKRCGYPALL
jgi:hypothetical protein